MRIVLPGQLLRNRRAQTHSGWRDEEAQDQPTSINRRDRGLPQRCII
jgi:hypothetical protein